jgi:hypothetical protein
MLCDEITQAQGVKGHSRRLSSPCETYLALLIICAAVLAEPVLPQAAIRASPGSA